jgi:hypothetical protein
LFVKFSLWFYKLRGNVSEWMRKKKEKDNLEGFIWQVMIGWKGRYALRWSTFHNQEYLIERVNFAKNLLQNLTEIMAKAALVTLCVWNIANGGSLTVGTFSMLIQYQYKLVSLFLSCCCSYWPSVYLYRGMMFGPLAQLSQLFARARRFLRRSEGSNNERWQMRRFWFLTATSNFFFLNYT